MDPDSPPPSLELLTNECSLQIKREQHPRKWQTGIKIFGISIEHLLGLLVTSWVARCSELCAIIAF